MRHFEYVQGETAVDIPNQLSINTLAFAGGTDLLTRMKLELTTPEMLIDVKTADLPKGITQTEDGITIGALTTLTDIETSELLAEKYTLLSEAASLAATPQLRNRATIGGNLLQRPRCWYYRNQHIDCWLKGGNSCPAKEGQNQFHAIFETENPCIAVHPSDLAGCLLALDATVTLRGQNGERNLSMADFYDSPPDDRRRETTIDDDELILSIFVPSLPEGTRSRYLKAMDRKVWAFAMVGVAAVLQMNKGRVQDVRLALNGVANVPLRLNKAEEMLIEEHINANIINQCAAVALSDAQPLEQNRYKVPLAEGLLKRALTELGE